MHCITNISKNIKNILCKYIGCYNFLKYLYCCGIIYKKNILYSKKINIKLTFDIKLEFNDQFYLYNN
jgi:hypothetical protein